MPGRLIAEVHVRYMYSGVQMQVTHIYMYMYYQPNMCVIYKNERNASKWAAFTLHHMNAYVHVRICTCTVQCTHSIVHVLCCT